jgi:prepilin-type N-terminal cleavage/methylation domain-containing protein
VAICGPAGNQKSEVRSWRPEARSRKPEVRNAKLAVRSFFVFCRSCMGSMNKSKASYSHHRVNAPSSQSGFSLLEVIVATAIVALVFVSMMEIFSSGLRTEGRADEYATAMQQGTRVMNDLWINTLETQPSRNQGRFDDDTTWRSSVEVFRLPGEALDSSNYLPMEKMILRVEVTWNSRGSEKKVQLQSIKNVLKGSSKP